MTRLSEGNYTIGTKKIMCRIVNGRLLVRVGGGFMSIEEYLEQYGKGEAGKHTLNLEITEEIIRGGPSSYDVNAPLKMPYKLTV